jgi:hypothetical protein
MLKPIESFQIVDHGIESPDYFQGCGLFGTDFTDVATGIGDNAAEAIADALESLAQNDWGVDGMEARICADIGKKKLPTKPVARGEDSYYHISIRVK